MIIGVSNRWFDRDHVLVVVVATMTEGVDWAAYQDAVAIQSMAEPDKQSHSAVEDFLVNRACRNGDKVSEAEARALFLDIDLPYRR